MKRTLCILLAALLMLSLTGCAGNPPAESGCLDVVNSPATTLNNVWYNTGGIFRCAVFDSLVATEADMRTIVPALAEEYHVSADGVNYTFRLREQVKWHDGDILDAQDVLFSVKMLLRSPEVNGLLSSAFQYIDGAEEYKAGLADEIRGVTVEGNRITFRLSSPVSSFLKAMAQFAILPEHLLGGVNPSELETSSYWKQPVGCGPYRITETAEGEYFLLECNKDYYGAKPGVEKIRLKMNVENPVAAMHDGTLDFYVTSDPDEIAQLKGAENCTGHRLNILFPTYLIFNLSDDEGVNEYLKDVRVRKALLLAIDQQAIVDVLFPGSTMLDTMVPSWDSWYWAEGEKLAYDPERARQLLDEVGFDGAQPIRLRYFTKGQATADLMSAIATYWSAIGVKVDLEMFEGSGSQHMFQIRDYDVCYKRLSAFNHAAIYEEMAGDGVMQNSIYHLPVYDPWIEMMDVTMDEDARREIVFEMQKLDQEYLLRLPLFALANFAYVNEIRFQMPEAYGNLWYRYDLHFEDWRLLGQ